MKLKLALIGKNISHSLSPSVYEKLLGSDLESYSLLDYESEFDIPPVKQLLSEFDGISVTAPYKKYMLNQCDSLTEEAKITGSINCIKYINKKVIGGNSDFLALEKILPDLVVPFENIIVLGNGSMFNLSSLIFRNMNTSFRQIFRKQDGDFTSIDLRLYTEPLLVINTCSRDFLFKGMMNSSDTYYDFNYSLQKQYNIFQKINVDYIDGEKLLFLQAEFALIFWCYKT